jgi:VRR-NUC domain/Fanconi anemia-associated nuclease SAP domain
MRSRPVLADPFYYLNNFKAVLSSLEGRYRDLLSDEESQFIARFAELPRPSCALLVRMVMRKGRFFRLSGLYYPEIGNTDEAVAPLVEVGWLQEPVLDVSQLHRLLTKDELIEHLRLPRRLSKLDKAALLDAAREHYPESRQFRDWCKHSSDRVYDPLVKPIAERFRLMFFGNFRQDWTEFVLADLGMYRYEAIPLQSSPFRTRAQFEAFQQLYRCQRSLEEGAEIEQVIASIPPPLADNDWLEDVRQKLLFHIATAYQQLNDVASAIAMFSTCKYRGSRIRTIRLLERSGQWQAARDLCSVARANPEGEAERQQLRRLLPRLSRKLGIAGENTRVLSAVDTFDLPLDTSGGFRCVEIMVRDYLSQQQGPPSTVHYVENGLINSLFGLLFWDAIFAPIPGAFFHDFQYGPADLASGQFYERRKSQFAEGFAKLDSGEYKIAIRRRFCAKAGIQAPFVTWGLLTGQLLESALRCFPETHLRLWFQWIVQDVVENRAGFPDLVQFWPSENRYRMVEVKGPGDRLQDNQRRFFEFCNGHGMPVFVCQVRGLLHERGLPRPSSRR